jgi:hypothetical protein
MTRCKEAYDKRREVKKIKGQVCSTERSDRVFERGSSTALALRGIASNTKLN